MKIKTYIQVAKTKHGSKLRLTSKPNLTPISNGLTGHWRKFYPTIQFQVAFNVPDELFQ